MRSCTFFRSCIPKRRPGLAHRGGLPSRACRRGLAAAALGLQPIDGLADWSLTQQTPCRQTGSIPPVGQHGFEERRVSDLEKGEPGFARLASLE